MTTSAMNSLWTYIESLGMSARNRKWLAEKLMSKTDHTDDITKTPGYKEAMDDIKCGRVYKADSIDDMFNQILG